MLTAVPVLPGLHDNQRCCRLREIRHSSCQGESSPRLTCLSVQLMGKACCNPSPISDKSVALRCVQYSTGTGSRPCFGRQAVVRTHADGFGSHVTIHHVRNDVRDIQTKSAC